MNTCHHITPFWLALLLFALPAPTVLAQAPSDDTALPEGIEATGDTAEVRALTAWAEEHWQTDPEQAQQVAERALALARELDDQRGVGVSLTTLGRLISDLQQEEAYYTAAREAFEQIGDERDLIRNRLHIGNVYRRRGDLERALTAYFDALEGFERLGDVEGQATVLNNIGLVQKSQGNWEEEVSYYERALALANGLDKPDMLAYIHNNLGNAFTKIGAYEDAEIHFRRALDISEEQEFLQYMAAISNNLGFLFNEQGSYEQALPFLVAAERVSRELGDNAILFAVTDEFGKAYMGLDRYDRALRYANESLALARESGLLSRQIEAHQTLSRIYKKAGNYEQALVHHEHYVAARDSVLNAEKTEIVTEMQTRYESEEKQRAIERLEYENQIRLILFLAGVGGLLLLLGFLYNRYRLKQKANRLLNARKEEILREKKEKEVLLQEIHHRVKNNLQVIAGLLGIQAKGARGADALATLREAQGRVQAITLLHQKLYRDTGLTQVYMQEYMEDLSAYLIQAFHADDLTCRVKADGIKLDVDTAVPLGLITNELVSNAFEHAFQDSKGGEVHICLRERDESTYELEVSDNGRGFSSERLDDNGSVGMKLVESLTHQLRGRLHIENGQGVTARVCFEKRETAHGVPPRREP